MEKYMSLLNPKTVNYEMIRVDGVIAKVTAQDVLCAMSYAKLTDLQNTLIKLKCIGACSLIEVDDFVDSILANYSPEFIQKKLATKYHLTVIRVAVIEFVLMPINYKPSKRNRAELAGVSDFLISTLLKQYIDFVFQSLKEQYELAEEKIFFQICKSK